MKEAKLTSSEQENLPNDEKEELIPENHKQPNDKLDQIEEVEGDEEKNRLINRLDRVKTKLSPKSKKTIK